MLWRQTIPQRDVVKRYLFELGNARRLEGSGGFVLQKKERKEKKKIKSSFPRFFSFFLSSPSVVAAADDDDVDQRKVTEGKMHIEKALGNI